MIKTKGPRGYYWRCATPFQQTETYSQIDFEDDGPIIGENLGCAPLANHASPKHAAEVRRLEQLAQDFLGGKPLVIVSARTISSCNEKQNDQRRSAVWESVPDDAEILRAHAGGHVRRAAPARHIENRSTNSKDNFKNPTMIVAQASCRPQVTTPRGKTFRDLDTEALLQAEEFNYVEETQLPLTIPGLSASTTLEDCSVAIISVGKEQPLPHASIANQTSAELATTCVVAESDVVSGNGTGNALSSRAQPSKTDERPVTTKNLPETTGWGDADSNALHAAGRKHRSASTCKNGNIASFSTVEDSSFCETEIGHGHLCSGVEDIAEHFAKSTLSAGAQTQADSRPNHGATTDPNTDQALPPEQFVAAQSQTPLADKYLNRRLPPKDPRSAERSVRQLIRDEFKLSGADFTSIDDLQHPSSTLEGSRSENNPDLSGDPAKRHSSRWHKDVPEMNSSSEARLPHAQPNQRTPGFPEDLASSIASSAPMDDKFNQKPCTRRPLGEMTQAPLPTTQTRIDGRHGWSTIKKQRSSADRSNLSMNSPRLEKTDKNSH